MKDYSQLSFQIIRHKGELNKATTLDGYVVYRDKRLFVVEMGRFIPCAPYEEHFIYEEPSKKKGTSSYMCTCGSAAVISGVSGYKEDASPSGYMFVCLLHATNGHHTDTSKTRWI